MGDWHYFNEFVLHGVRFDSSFDHGRVNAAFFVKDPSKKDDTVLTLGWGPYYVEVIVRGHLYWRTPTSRHMLSANDLLAEGMTDESIAYAESTGTIIKYASPSLMVRVDGVTGEEGRVLGPTFSSLPKAFDLAHEVLSKWVSHSEDPVPF